MFGPSSSYIIVPSFRKPSSRFVMYTTSCCSGSSVPNVDPSPSLSQLNSSIEIFSQLPVFSVGSACSSSCFCSSVVLTCLFAIFSGSSQCSFSAKLSVDSQHIIADSTLSFLSWIRPLRSLIQLPFYLFHRVSICPDFLALRFLFPQKSCHFRTD